MAAKTLTKGITVRRRHGLREYGPWLPLDHDAVPQWVADAIIDEIADHGTRTGIIYRTGMGWAWRQD